MNPIHYLDMSEGDPFKALVALDQALALEHHSRPGSWIPGLWLGTEDGPTAVKWRRGDYDLRD